MKELLLKTIYGNYKIKEPLVDIINTSTIQRLKKISQRGAAEYFKPYKNFISRYDHSIGVLAILIRYNADMATQIAGILHDASHTVFSHVGDIFFEHKEHKSSYQDEIHEWFLKTQKINNVLVKYGFSLEEILHKSGHHKILEQDLPNICADRLEYNLEIGLQENLINKNDIENILNDLTFKNEKWYFSSIKLAKKFSTISLHMTETDWASADNIFAYNQLAQALKRAAEIQIITHDDIHFSTDDVVWEKLENSKDPQISSFLEKVKNPTKYIHLSNQNDFDAILYGKFRGIDPLVKTDKDFLRLSQIDSNFKDEYKRVKKLINNGWRIKYIN